MFAKNIFLLLIMVIGMSACLSPIQAPAITTYVFDAKPMPVTKKSYRRLSLYVAPIMSHPLYNTKNMAYSTSPHQIDYFVKSEWATTPAKMLAPLIIQTLQKTKHFHAVSNVSNFTNYDYSLVLEIVRLEQVFSHDKTQSVMHFTVRAQLINQRSNRMVATKQFTIQEVAAPNPYGGVVASNKALSRALKQVARFCVEQTR
jgi:cholesterol transport system auxiliary component